MSEKESAEKEPEPKTRISALILNTQDWFRARYNRWEFETDVRYPFRETLVNICLAGFGLGLVGGIGLFVIIDFNIILAGIFIIGAFGFILLGFYFSGKVYGPIPKSQLQKDLEKWVKQRDDYFRKKGWIK